MFTADAAVGVRPVQVLAGVDFGGNNLKEIGTGGTQLLSTECMNCTFTGCFVGLTAQGDCEAKYRYFDVSVPANE